MSRDFHILLIEDSRADVKIIERALAETSVAHRLTVHHDGKSALEYLATLKEPAAEPVEHPDLILLDLNLPGIDGAQVLAQIKLDPRLRAIPVVVLTTSRREEDISEIYLAGANTFIQKPSEYPKYRDLVKILELYWEKTALLPSWGRMYEN